MATFGSALPGMEFSLAMNFAGLLPRQTYLKLRYAKSKPTIVKVRVLGRWQKLWTPVAYPILCRLTAILYHCWPNTWRARGLQHGWGTD